MPQYRLKFYAANDSCFPLAKNTAQLIWTALLVSKGYCLDMATIYLCLLSYMIAIRSVNLW